MPTRTKPIVENQIVGLIAQHYTYTDISSLTGVSVSGIKKIKRRNIYRLMLMERELMDWQIDEIKKIQRRVFEQLHRRLDHDNEISIRELVSITHEMHEQEIASK